MGGNGRYKHTMETPGRKIVMTRVFDAPRELVFDAHSSCEHVSNWWGPRNYEVVDCEIDFRPGGAWRIAHRGPDGGPYETPVFFGEYREIVRPERFVWTFGFEGMPGEPGPETYVFEEHDGKTTLTSTAEFDTIEQRDALLETGMEEGAAETWDRLDEYLEVLTRRATG
jgi:uncharacterized protein YndB with AHSA1/START domain